MLACWLCIHLKESVWKISALLLQNRWRRKRWRSYTLARYIQKMHFYVIFIQQSRIKGCLRWWNSSSQHLQMPWLLAASVWEWGWASKYTLWYSVYVSRLFRISKGLIKLPLKVHLLLSKIPHTWLKMSLLLNGNINELFFVMSCFSLLVQWVTRWNSIPATHVWLLARGACSKKGH